MLGGIRLVFKTPACRNAAGLKSAALLPIALLMGYASSTKDGALERIRREMENIRTLIVDDSSVMRKIVERSLRQAGLSIAEVLEAANGAEALAAVQNHTVDLILCDISMPVMDGLEFVKQLSAVDSTRKIPVVMITTESSEGHVVQALSAGARGYIRKPFTPDHVKEQVLPVLEAK